MEMGASSRIFISIHELRLQITGEVEENPSIRRQPMNSLGISTISAVVQSAIAV
jgi:hypothetical protein